VCEACEQIASLRCAIKWPNDVWIDGRKVAGILIEGRPQEGWAVLGLGLNVTTAEDEFPDELRGIATSLSASAEGSEPPPDREILLERVLRALESRLSDQPGAIIAAWRERDALRGCEVRWQGGAGIATGIDDSGALKVETDAGLVTLEAGEVHLLT
jgi:BirA family biotin operon repressor/biotin-[acetyl-CoA-carboxylase] ligase